MSTMTMNPPPVHRKPLPGRAAPAPAPPYDTTSSTSLHSRTRTSSSNTMPSIPPSDSNPNTSPAYSMTQQAQQGQQPYNAQTRRTMSSTTGSSTSSSSQTNNGGLQRAPTSSTFGTADGVRRSTSSRSNSSVSPTSYVALMRKQKATVWCDRAQNEDPRILAAQRQAKMRAAAEVAGGQSYTAASRTSTGSSGVVGGVRSKIRHHGAPKASAYNATLQPGGAGVPMRLSASEVDDGNNSDEDVGGQRYHVRNGSGRSSNGSGRKHHSFQTSTSQRQSTGNTPPGGSPVDSMDELREEETPMANGSQYDYFGAPSGTGSGSSEEEHFDQVGGLPTPRGLTAEQQIQQQKANADDLQRRGSVDERTMTLSGPRLFVANPDLSD